VVQEGKEGTCALDSQRTKPVQNDFNHILLVNANSKAWGKDKLPVKRQSDKDFVTIFI
jgi:hypothetical protein